MKIFIDTIAVFQTVPGKIEAALPQGSDFRALVEEVSLSYPEFGKLLRGNRLDDNIVVLRNGQSILLQEGADTELLHGDELFIVPMTYGG